MFDQTFNKYRIDKVKKSSSTQNLTINTSLRDIRKFNPFELIPGETPISCYESLAVFNDFSLVSCNNGINPANFTYLDLDDTEGFSIAVQGRYPNALCYGLGNRLGSIKWNFDKNGLNSSKFDLSSSSYKALLAKTLHYNSRGILLSYCTLNEDELDITAKLRATINVLGTGGSAIIRINDYTSDKSLELLTPLDELFEDLFLYKSAVTSCVSTECLLICLRKDNRRDEEDKIIPMSYEVEKIDRSGGLLRKQIENLEEARRIAEASIAEYCDNRFSYNVSGAKSSYLGLIA